MPGFTKDVFAVTAMLPLFVPCSHEDVSEALDPFVARFLAINGVAEGGLLFVPLLGRHALKWILPTDGGLSLDCREAVVVNFGPCS